MTRIRAYHSLRGISFSLNAALQLLRATFDLARHEQIDAWCLSLHIDVLRGIGLQDNDFRWLVRSGYVEHSLETTAPGRPDRMFRRTRRLHLTEATCFVLTDLGRAFAQQDDEHTHRNWNRTTTGRSLAELPAATPGWNPDLRELRAGPNLVKRYHQPSGNQELVLTAFQAAGWPPYIDDPFPREHGRCAKRHLCATAGSLNRQQAKRRIRFGFCGKGTQITWEWR